MITPNEAYIPNVWVGRQQQITSGKGRVSEGRGNGGEDLTEKKTLRGRRRERLSSEGGFVCHVGKKRERKYNAHGMIQTTDSAALWTVGMRAAREWKGGLAMNTLVSVVQQLRKATSV